MSLSRKILSSNLPDHNLVITSIPPPKYSPSHWKFDRSNKFQIINDQEKLSERVIAYDIINYD